jgi:hypothetical protein
MHFVHVFTVFRIVFSVLQNGFFSMSFVNLYDLGVENWFLLCPQGGYD